MNHGSIIFLNGVSGSGKTSIAHALQRFFETPFLHVSVDDFLQTLPTRFTDFFSGMAELSESKLEKLRTYFPPRLQKAYTLCIYLSGGAVRTRVRKWGNSLALRIPKSFAAETRLEPDSEVHLGLVEGKLVVTPVVKAEPSLEGLLSGVTEDNLHAEVGTGAPSGNEVW